jgi:hypothetical protein
MSAAMISAKADLIGITVKFTPAEHAALKIVVFAAGHTSFQNFFRSYAVQKIREAEGRSREPADAER